MGKSKRLAEEPVTERDQTLFLIERARLYATYHDQIYLVYRVAFREMADALERLLPPVEGGEVQDEG